MTKTEVTNHDHPGSPLRRRARAGAAARRYLPSNRGLPRVRPTTTVERMVPLAHLFPKRLNSPLQALGCAACIWSEPLDSLEVAE